MSIPVGDHILERLGTWGVQRVYGYPGDGINGVMGAFSRSSASRRRRDSAAPISRRSIC